MAMAMGQARGCALANPPENSVLEKVTCFIPQKGDVSIFSKGFPAIPVSHFSIKQLATRSPVKQVFPRTLVRVSDLVWVRE